VPHYDIESLRTRERQRTARTTNVVEVFRAFREGFLSLLAQFSEEALALALDGVVRLARKADDADFIDCTITLNHYPLFILSTTEAIPLDALKDELVCRMFVYSHNHPNATPLLDVSFHEKPDNRFAASAQWFTSEGPAPLGSAFPFGPEGSSMAGQEMAEHLLGLIYRFERSWREKPTLDAIRIDRTAARPLGFHTDRGSA